MKICIYAPAFFPMVGGLESMTLMLAEAFSEKHEVDVITNAVNEKPDDFPFRVHRIGRRSFFAAYKIIRKADIFLEFNFSWYGFIPYIFTRKPVFVINHGGVNHNMEDPRGLWGNIKYKVANRFAKNIACSEFVGHYYKDAVVIPNCYDDRLFTDLHLERNKELLFLGRLVSQKGINTLLEAVKLLQENGKDRHLTVIGRGSEEEKLKSFCAENNITDKVTFAGLVTGTELSRQMNRHRVMIVPSLGDEGFGIVALEGMACGCQVIVSNSGGLPEAVGDAGYVFEKGNASQLAETIEKAFADGGDHLVVKIKEHLRRHTIKEISGRFLGQFGVYLGTSKMVYGNEKEIY